MQQALATFDSEITKKLPSYPTLQKLLALFGLAALSYKAYDLLSFSFRHFVRPRKNLLQRYGPGTWVAVTGATDGIGKEFCIKFARIGFNIVLISRDSKKLAAVAEEIKKENASIEVKTVTADFGNWNQDGFFEAILEQIKELDISVLINNVGQSGNHGFADFSVKELF